MYSEVKNPFGLRNGIHITVNDLCKDERGLACNCVCPLCKDPFEARLGSVRIHHFAHSGVGCNEIDSYLMGLYGFFKDYLDSQNCLIPELNVYYYVDNRSDAIITKNNYTNQISFCPNSIHSKKITLSKDISIRFECSEIVVGKANRPEAVVATYHERKIAFVISPPDTVCKGFHANPYKDIATIEITLSKKADLISRANTEMMIAIFSDINNYRWLFSPLVFSAFDKINEEKVEAFRAYQEKVKLQCIQAEEEQKKQAELQRQENENRQKQQEDLQKADAERRERELKEEAQREENERRKIGQMIETPNQMVVDSHGRRWILCETCGKTATDEEFWKYQWNRGQCKDCLKKYPSFEIPKVK